MNMNLPNYYLADLPPEATLTAAMVAEACQALRKNREQYLKRRDTAAIIRVLADLAANWRDPEYSFRQAALETDPALTGFSAPVLARGLDAFFGQLTEANLRGLLEQDLGHEQRLDKLAASDLEQKTRRQAIARGPELIFHITAGTLPVPALMSMVLGLLTRSAQFVKCATGGAQIPRLFAHSLYEAEPKLGACLEVAQWRGGAADLEGAMYAEADCVTATGGDEAIEAIRRQLPHRTRFLAYGHRVSFGFIAREELSRRQAREWAARVADDVAAWDQLGCLSPHVIYVQRDGQVSPEYWAELLAEELARREVVEPRGPVSIETSAAIASRRSVYELRAAGSVDTRFWQSPDSTAWTVVYEADPRFQLSCLHRFVYVKSVERLADALQGVDAVRGQVSTVGLGAEGPSAADLAQQLAAWGATRVCRLGQMQNPPLTWRHDGRPALGDLVTWTNFEF